MVRQGSKTIGRQQAAMTSQVHDLSELLEQNAALQRRVHAAAERTTTLNEQSLRRTSADLHDGPGQALALALLRLDDVKARQGATSPQDQHEFEVVHGAVRDAMTEMRAIAAGLRLPELGPLSIAQVAARAVDDHQRRSGIQVELEIGDVPERASLAVKIALLRTLQEALSNATRHGGGLGISARLWSTDGVLWLTVADHGPGLRQGPDARNGGLGLANMRERAELLGGSFDIESVPSNGALVRVSWPLTEETDERPED
jgi:signal transduction histidine kinase